MDCDSTFASACDDGCARISGTDTCTCNGGKTLNSDGKRCDGKSNKSNLTGVTIYSRTKIKNVNLTSLLKMSMSEARRNCKIVTQRSLVQFLDKAKFFCN